MATARYHYADLSLVCQSSLSIMSERNWSRNIMRQKSNFVFIQISSQVLTKRSNRRVLKRLGRASRPHDNDRLLWRDFFRAVERGAIAAWSGLDFLLSTVIVRKSAARALLACNS